MNTRKTETGEESPTYTSWRAMKARCNNLNSDKARYYSELDIKVCAEWYWFENFLADMGERPAGTTLERRNSSKHYCKDNCCWATGIEQAKVKAPRCNNITKINGVSWLTGHNICRARASYAGKKYILYQGPDFFEACCARKSWENARDKDML